MPIQGTRWDKSELPTTGQALSLQDVDDGALQEGNPIVTRWVDNGDGTMTDRTMRLMWYKNNLPGGPYTIANAITACNALTTRGFTDWRVPNANEILSRCKSGGLGICSGTWVPGSDGVDGSMCSTPVQFGNPPYRYHNFDKHCFDGFRQQTDLLQVLPVRSL